MSRLKSAVVTTSVVNFKNMIESCSEIAKDLPLVLLAVFLFYYFHLIFFIRLH